MSMIADAVISISLRERVEWGWIRPGRIKYSINKVRVKKANGKVAIRYAVLINDGWKSNEYFTHREAKENVRILIERNVWKMTLDEMVGLCKEIDGLYLYSLSFAKGVDNCEYILVYKNYIVGNEFMTADKVKTAIKTIGE